MKGAGGFFRHPVTIVTLWTIALAAVCISLLSWELGANFLQIFTKYWWIFILIFSAIASLTRKFFLKKSAYIISCLVLFFALYLLAFHAKFIPQGAQPTTTYIILFLFAVYLLLALFLDIIAKGLCSISKIKYIGPIVKNPLGYLILSLLGIWLFCFLLKSKPGAEIAAFFQHYWLVLIIIFSLLSSFLRISRSKSFAIPQSIALFFLSYIVWFHWLKFDISKLTSIGFYLFIAGWLHFNMEAILDYGKRAYSIMPKLSGHAKKAIALVKDSLFYAWQKLWEHKKKVVIGIAALVVIIIIAAVLIRLYNHYFIQVVEFSPKGSVPQKTVIRISFSEPISLTVSDVKNLNCFQIEPAIEGEYRMESDRTVVFVPRKPLTPSTRYQVKFSSQNLKPAQAAKKMPLSAKTEFNTALLRVVDTKLFYIYDLAKNLEKSVMGEISFNYAVEFQELQKNIIAFQEDKPIQIELEKSNIPTRFYFKTGLIQREEKPQQVKIVVQKGLQCIGGITPMEADYVSTLKLPAKVKFAVTDIKLWHEPGNTYITILFNMPVSREQVEGHIEIDPPASYQIETEYCYAVLRGNFIPNRTYKVKVRPGVISRTGEVLGEKETREESIRISDLPAKVKFVQKKHILPLYGEMNVEFATINLDKVSIEVDKIFRNNVFAFLQDYYSSKSKNVLRTSYTIREGRINEEQTQYLNLRRVHNQEYKGLFQVTIRDPRDYYNKDSSWFLCTDLGIIAKQSGNDLIVYVLSVKTLQPVAAAEVNLISESNQIMDKKITDEAGRAVFSNWQSRRQDNYWFYAYALIVEHGDDFSFMKFDSNRLNQHQFPIEGEAFSLEGMEAYLTPERGVYRPGEKAYITGIVRNRDYSTPPSFPVLLVVRDPKGSEFARLEKRFNNNGMTSFDISFPPDVLTGQYNATLFTPVKMNYLGQTSFKVEEFIPDKLKVEILTDKDVFDAREQLTFTVEGRQMFGPPAQGNKVETTLLFLPRTFTHPSFKEYTFIDPSRTFHQESMQLGQDKLNELGRKKYALNLPRWTPPSALIARLYTEVFDSGGRPVSADKVVSINSYPYYLGIKVEKKPAFMVDDKIDIKYVAIDSSGEFQEIKNLQILVKRKVWYSIFHRASWGRSSYQSDSYEEVVLQKVVDTTGSGEFSFTPDVAGEYSIFIGNEESMRTGTTLHVFGPGYQAWSLEAPEKLELTLNKESYDLNEYVGVNIRAPFDGKLFLTVERESVYDTQIINVTDRIARAAILVKPHYLPNAYIVGLLVRTPDEENKTLPMVSFGIVPLEVNKDTRKIVMDLNTVEETQSREGIDVSLQVDSYPEATNVVLAAVDEGILQLTNFSTPDPFNFFYRKKGMTTQSYSIFDLILPDVIAKREAIGGGVEEETMAADKRQKFAQRHLNPVVAKKPESLAQYSGILTPDASGRINYHFVTKNFSGEVRVMAMAVRNDKYSSADRSVTVADPITLQPSFPRFVAPTDEFQVPVLIYNKTKKEDDFLITLKGDGPIKIVGDAEKKLHLRDGAQDKVVFLVQADKDAGVAHFNVAASGGGFAAESAAELSVRPATHLQSIVKSAMLKPERTTSFTISGNYIPYGQNLRFTFSSNRLVQYLRSLDYLITYPYGCTEQITSRIFPLLYFKDLGYATGRFSQKANAVDYFIQEGIKKLEKNQLADGSFAMWSGGTSSYSLWMTLYASHCLIEANRLGYKVNPTVISRIYSYINKGSVMPQYEGRLDRRQQSGQKEVNTYLLYLKGLIGRPDREAMSYLRTQKLSTLDEVDRCFLSMCYSHIGDKNTAAAVLKKDFKSKFLYREQYGSFNSPIRNTALYLCALAMANPTSGQINDIIAYLGKYIKDGHFGSTQENAWIFMALGNAVHQFDYPIALQMLVNDQPYRTIEGKTEIISDNSLTGKKVTLKNSGTKDTYYYFIIEGTPLKKKEKDRFNGIEIRRDFYDENGKKINLGSVLQGDLIVVTITAKAVKDDLHNVIVLDLLPGGFEIDNPRLKSQGTLKFKPRSSFSPAYQDIRDDRILFFIDRLSGEQSFSYTARAVTPGKYIIPNIYTEVMYDPEINGEAYEKDYLVVVPNN
jgi:uncharacterized protein YfaS (alpha-2-macroglobulin family)